MKELIVHVNNKLYDETNLHMDELLLRSMRKEKGYREDNLEQDHMLRQEIADKLNKAEENNKELLDEFSKEAKLYFKDLRKAGMRDWLIDPLNRSRITGLNHKIRSILLVMGFPIFAIGVAANILPYWLVQYISKKVLRVKKEFYSSITLGVGIFLLMFNYILLFFLIYFFSPNILCPLLSCVVAFFSGIFALDFQFFIRKTFGMGRALKNRALFEEFSQRREKLISLINRF
jgi:hypothetical protein